MLGIHSSVATEELVPPEEPNIAARVTASPEMSGIGSSVALVSFGLSEVDAQIDLAHVEADRLDVEVEFDARQRLQLLGQEPIIPRSDLRQPVIRDHEGSLLGL